MRFGKIGTVFLNNSWLFLAPCHLKCMCSVSYASKCFKLWEIVPITIPEVQIFGQCPIWFSVFEWTAISGATATVLFGSVMNTSPFSRLKSTVQLPCTGYRTSWFEKTTLLFIKTPRKFLTAHRRSAANSPLVEVIHGKFLGCILTVISHIPYKLLTDA